MPFQVDVWEYERGWGAKVDFKVYFNEIHHADEYVKTFNAKNTELTAPDWYMQAKEAEFIRTIPAGETAKDEGLLL